VRFFCICCGGSKVNCLRSDLKVGAIPPARRARQGRANFLLPQEYFYFLIASLKKIKSRNKKLCVTIRIPATNSRNAEKKPAKNLSAFLQSYSFRSWRRGNIVPRNSASRYANATTDKIMRSSSMVIIFSLRLL